MRRLGAGAATVVVAAGLAVAVAPAAYAGEGHRTFYSVGAPEAYVVPGGVTAVRISAYGGSGGPGLYGGGGAGSSVSAVLAVTPGETLWVRAGGAAGDAEPGYNGGGSGTRTIYYEFHTASGGGGGASDVRRGGDTLANRVVVAGGGGGASAGGTEGGGGDSRGTNGWHVCYECGVREQPNGGDAGPGPWSTGTGARGAVSTDTNGTCAPQPPTSGAPGQGGDAGRPCGSPCDNPSACTYLPGGGGGGGYWGGGAGGTGQDTASESDPGGGGGGGSSYADPSATEVSFAPAAHQGDGYVVIDPVAFGGGGDPAGPVASTCTVTPAAGRIGIVAEAQATYATAVTTTVECVVTASDGSRTVVAGSSAGPVVAAVGGRAHRPARLTVCTSSTVTWAETSQGTSVVLRDAAETPHCHVTVV